MHMLDDMSARIHRVINTYIRWICLFYINLLSRDSHGIEDAVS